MSDSQLLSSYLMLNICLVLILTQHVYEDAPAEGVPLTGSPPPGQLVLLLSREALVVSGVVTVGVLDPDGAVASLEVADQLVLERAEVNNPVVLPPDTSLGRQT